MAQRRGNEKDEEGLGDPLGADESDAGSWVPDFQDLARRAIALGLSGFFSTEEKLRRALGDTLPRDWTDFAVEQSDRARREFLERLSSELARSLERVDLAAVLRELLEGRSIEVHASIRLSDDGGEKHPSRLRVELSGTERGE
jgi:hypothetical protein